MPNVAAFSSQIRAGVSRVHLLPAGEFSTVDGRKFRLAAQDAERLIERAASRKSAMVLDYEHQTMLTAQNGQPAPAAGWFKALEFHPDGEHAGLFAADVALTERARVMVQADPPEYRYASAVFEYQRAADGVAVPTRLLHAALTNNPAVDGQRAIEALTSQENRTVSLTERLIASLSLATAATEDEIVAGVDALNARADAADSEVATLKARTAPDLSQYVPVATFTGLQQEFAALKARTDAAEVDALLSQAIEDGKPIAAATETWLRDLARANGVAALKVHLEAMPTIAALKASQTGGKPPAAKGDTLDAEQAAICKQVGISIEAFKAARAAA